jgi:hypothetical protein
MIDVNTATREELINEIARLTRENQRLSEANSNMGWDISNAREEHMQHARSNTW